MKILTGVGFNYLLFPCFPGSFPFFVPRFSKVLSGSPGPVSSHASKYRY